MEQKISITSKEKKIPQLLQSISDISKTGIVFSDQLFIKSARKKIDFDNTALGEILLYVLAKEKVNFKIIGSEIVLFKELPQEKYTLSGFVREQRTGEGIVGAAVVRPYINKGTFSNVYGFYSLTLPSGFHKIKYYSFGSQESNGFIYLESDTTINKYLETTLTLSEIIVTGVDSSGLLNIKETSKDKLSSNAIQNAPGLAGESDLIRSTFLLPGVQSGGDGLGGLFVRGGSLDQNLVLLDGVPVYNPSHLVGIFSVFNSDAIRSAELYKGAIPSKYGGRLSSVLDVRTKEGNEKELDASVGLGLVSLKASIEGPIVKDRAAFFVSYRRSLLDLLLKPITQSLNEGNQVEGFANYNFQDINVKVNSRVGQRNQFFLSLYRGGDLFEDNRQRAFEEGLNISKEKFGQNVSWGNTIGSFRWNHIIGNRIFSNSTITFSRYDFNSQSFIGFTEEIIDSIYIEEFDVNQVTSKIEDIAFKQDLEFFINPNHELRFGTNIIIHKFDPSIVTLNETSDSSITYANALDEGRLDQITQPIDVYDGAIYAEDEFRIGKKISGNIGFRATWFNTQGENYFSLQPRIALNYELIAGLMIRAAYDQLDQPLHLLQRSRIGLPSDLWIPSSKRIVPEKGWQLLSGASFKINETYDIGLEGYYKEMNNLLIFKPGATLNRVDGQNIQEEVATGMGRAYGAEVWLRKSKGKVKGSINYTYALSERSFSEINEGAFFPFRYDRRHFVKLLASLGINKKWNFTGSWVFGTGNGTTVPIGVYELPSKTSFGIGEIQIFILSDINGFKMANYHRLDLAFNMIVRKEKFVQKLQLGVFNAYNRANPLYIGVRNNPESEKPDPVQYSLIPFIPSFSYSIKF